MPGEPIPESRPNKGSVKGRKRKKHIALRKAFILVLFVTFAIPQWAITIFIFFLYGCGNAELTEGIPFTRAEW